MKRIFLCLLLAAICGAVRAEEVPKKPSCSGFVSNGFWDNWEVTGAFGPGTALSNGRDLGAFGQRIGIEGNFSVTKWVHPVVGMRLQLQGGRFFNFDPVEGEMKWPYLFTHVDWLVNLSNWAGGYREDRAYYLVPFVGFGYMAANFTDESHRENQVGTTQNFAMAFGLLNKFRISASFDFNIELKGLLTPSRISPVRMDGAYLFGFSATAGFTYRFNKRGWERCGAGYTAADIRAYQQAAAASDAARAEAEAGAARLNEQLAAARAEARAARAAAANAAAGSVRAENAAAEAEIPVTNSLILFDYSMSTLTPQERTRLEVIADEIKNGSSDRVYRIEGYADPQTGTAAGNKRVAAHRAKRVYDFLVSLGVNPRQLTYEGMAGTQIPFENVQKANRSAIIR